MSSSRGSSRPRDEPVSLCLLHWKAGSLPLAPPGKPMFIMSTAMPCIVLRLLWPELCLGEGNGTPLQYSCLVNPMDGGAWWAAVHGIAESQTWLSDFTFTFHFHAWEKEMATHSSVLAWRIPGTGEPGRLPSMGSYRVGHNWSDLAAAAVELCLPKICLLKP